LGTNGWVLGSSVEQNSADNKSWPESGYERLTANFGSAASLPALPAEEAKSQKSNHNEPPFGPFDGCVPIWRVAVGVLGMFGGALVIFLSNDHRWLFGLGVLLMAVGTVVWLTGHTNGKECGNSEYRQPFQHDAANVSECVVYVVGRV
jgi:hypothetical protein